MPTNQQRRETERRRLQRQLEERRAREATRKRTTLIVSIVGTVVLIAAIIVVVVLLTGKKKHPAAASGPTHTSTPTPSTSSTAPVITTPTKPCSAAPKSPKNDTVTFDGVTVKNATNLTKTPTTTAHSQTSPTTVQCEDLVVGKGAAATPTSTVSVQYYGVLYADGKYFDSSWKRAGSKPISFPLTGVVPGFTQGIGGAGKVAPMKVGGRRIIIIPPALGYGAQGNGVVPANASLVFVVDLTKAS